jgi:hypothetical protein
MIESFHYREERREPSTRRLEMVVRQFEFRRRCFRVWRHPECSRFSGGAKDLARIDLDFSSREIPRPAGESAGLRNDASVLGPEFKLTHCLERSKWTNSQTNSQTALRNGRNDVLFRRLPMHREMHYRKPANGVTILRSCRGKRASGYRR